MTRTIWLLAIIAAGVSPSAASPERVQNPVARFTGVSTEREFRMDVPGTLRSGTSEVVLRLDQGHASWDLVDPSGAVRVSGEAESGVVRTLADLGTPGTWTVRLRLENATGAYEVRWLADGRPVTPIEPTIRFGTSPRQSTRCTT